MVLTGQFTTGSVLPSDEEVRKILVQRIDLYKQSVGIVVGLIDAEGRRVVSYGVMDPKDKQSVNADTIFEIGSVTKVFSSLLLSDMVQHGEVALDDPISKFLPPDVKVPLRNGRSIELQDLATHTSGLPGLPTNLKPKDPANPYADYTTQNLYDFLSNYTLPRDIGSQYEYSNLGAGLLGFVLARRAGKDYETMVRERICDPLGMNSTRITLSEDLKARFSAGHNNDLETVPHWDFLTLPGAGALRSSANDLLTFLSANLGLKDTPLKSALAGTLSVRRPAVPGVDIMLGWHILKRDGNDLIWHNGGTSGFSSFVGYDPKKGIGVVVLSNAFTTGSMTGVDDIGRHLLDATLPLSPPPQMHTAISLDPKIFDNYIGRYQLTSNLALTITHEDARLMVQPTGQNKFELFPESVTEYFAKVGEITISFETNDLGVATALIVHQNGRDTRAPRN
jgi:CubicO group peptidase (beta-lactamase class C family)